MGSSTRRIAAVVAVACLALLATACDLRLTPPGGPGPLRYRDEIFTGVTKTSNLVYGSAPSAAGPVVSLLLDLYQPTGDTVTSRPAIVWVHGGSFRSGNKSSAELVDEANTFSKKGFVNVSIDYRMTPNGCTSPSFPADCINGITFAQHDSQAAVRFLRANAATYGIDPTRIAIGGSSAGGITALNVAYNTTSVGSSGNPGFPSTVRAAASISGARILGTQDAGDAPTLLFHNTADPLVPYSSAVATRDGAVAAGLISELTTWEGAGHVPYLQHRTEILDQTTNFLYWTMNLPAAAT